MMSLLPTATAWSQPGHPNYPCGEYARLVTGTALLPLLLCVHVGVCGGAE